MARRATEPGGHHGWRDGLVCRWTPLVSRSSRLDRCRIHRSIESHGSGPSPDAARLGVLADQRVTPADLRPVSHHDTTSPGCRGPSTGRILRPVCQAWRRRKLGQNSGTRTDRVAALSDTRRASPPCFRVPGGLPGCIQLWAHTRSHAENDVTAPGTLEECHGRWSSPMWLPLLFSLAGARRTTKVSVTHRYARGRTRGQARTTPKNSEQVGNVYAHQGR